MAARHAEGTDAPQNYTMDLGVRNSKSNGPTEEVL